MGPELYNIYVEKLTNMVTELTKSNILQSAQIAFYEKQNTNLNSKVEELQRALDKANSKTKKIDSTDN